MKQSWIFLLQTSVQQESTFTALKDINFPLGGIFIAEENEKHHKYVKAEETVFGEVLNCCQCILLKKRK